jgi:hypothetical protein
MERQNDSTFLLTIVQRMCSLIDVARLRDIVSGLGEQTARQHKSLVASNDELSKLRAAAERFRVLEKSVRADEESLKIGIALLLNFPQKDNLHADAYPREDDAIDLRDDAGVIFSFDDLELSDFPLWKVMREVLRQTPEIRVFELESHLKSFGVKAARSAIESALATHGSQFRVTKRGREKFVSLK